MMDDVAEIAGRLTVAQRTVIWLRGEVCGMPFIASIMRPLVRRGFFSRVDRKGFQARWSLTPLGARVRSYLENNRG